MSREILINQLFAGQYLEEGDNIGHEVINLFKDDDDNINLFITPSGHVKGHELDCILFVRNVSARKTVEVIGLAKELSYVSDEEINQIKYAGVTLDKIFSGNTYRGEADKFTHHVTFRAKSFCVPSKRLFITIDKDFTEGEPVRLSSNRLVIIPQGMREYYSEQNDANAYKQLVELVNDDKLWRENNTQKLVPDGAVHNQMPSFLEVIRKEDDENIFSNLLAYYFEYSHAAFQRFSANSNLLGISNMSMLFSIYRETKERVDIWIESENDIIVIENKIKSGINGVTKDENNSSSQLDKYYRNAMKEAAESNKTAHFYIFAPD